MHWFDSNQIHDTNNSRMKSAVAVLCLLVLIVTMAVSGKCYMGLVARKPVFGVSEKVRFKPACSAT